MIEWDYFELKKWFLTEKRDLPWRERRDPYHIWISEVMLQQTQVAVVVPYFINWIQRLPDIRSLAEATLDQVIKMWEGLGYYSRARHLHEAAKYLVDHYQGQVPSDEENLKKIKGLGPYTIGAILSFAFHQKKAAVDGNVIRVLTRYLGLEDDITKLATLKKLRGVAQNLLPDEESWIINEAFIELGATICRKKPNCSNCPLKRDCVAFKKGIVDRLPIKSKKVRIEFLHRSVAVIQNADRYLVKRGDKGAIMSDLYEFPYFEMGEPRLFPQELQEHIERSYSLQITQRKILNEVDQGFTRYRVRLYPILFSCRLLKHVDNYEWLSNEALKKLAFSSGHRRIFQQLDAVSSSDLLLPI